MTTADRARTFARLHVAGTPLILVNAWDAGSARVVADAGARAIATASWAVAAAHGVGDGEQVAFALVIANLERIVGATDLPVTVDLERGYGDDPDAVGASVSRALAAGAVGCNLEDGAASGGLIPVEAAAARLRAARAAATASGVEAFLNARTDLFLQTPASGHDDAALDHALTRARAYAEAGASGLFLPGLVDPRLIERACAASPLPVNVMALPALPDARRLAALGVARISHGPGAFRAAMAALDRYSRDALAPGVA